MMSAEVAIALRWIEAGFFLALGVLGFSLFLASIVIGGAFLCVLAGVLRQQRTYSQPRPKPRAPLSPPSQTGTDPGLRPWGHH